MSGSLRPALVVLSVAALINLLYLCQHLLGWSAALRYGVGALLLLFSAISLQGGSSKALITRRHIRTTSQEDDLEFKQARRKGAAAGWQFITVGAATLGLTLLFP